MGYGKKENLEESRRCPQCAEPSCVNGERKSCSLGVDIPGFIRLLREDDTTGALERIRRQNPFPAICGRICPAPCETACIFNDEGAPIAIRSLERYASDFGKPKGQKEKVTFRQVGIKVAIVGSGPSGMSAAYYLAKEGFSVTVFEAMGELGGMLRYGIPEFRLPQKILDEQLAELESLGVKFQTDSLVSSTVSILDIFVQGHAAVLLAVGAGLPEFTDFPGNNFGGVYYAEEFLMRAQSLNKTKIGDNAKRLLQGTTTAILGCGYAAFDAAQFAIRLGQEVHIIFGGLEEEMGVHADDVRAALDEGVKLHVPVDPLSIEADDQGFAKSIVCQKMDVIEENGKLRLEPSADGQISIEAQTVILSNGTRPNPFIGKHLPQLQWKIGGGIVVDPVTGLTNVEKVFAAGNAVTGAGPVVDAIANGRSAAQHMIEFLKK